MRTKKKTYMKVSFINFGNHKLDDVHIKKNRPIYNGYFSHDFSGIYYSI